MLRYFSLLLMLFTVFFAEAQFSPTDTIDVSRFNSRLMEDILLDKINAYRKAKGVGELQNNPTIHKVAKDHCDYLKSRPLTHRQTTSGKQEIQDRLKYYTRARSFSVSENLARIYVLTPTNYQRSDGSTIQGVAYTYDEAATYLFNAWKNSKTHNTNMLNSSYNLSGIAVYLNPKDKTLTGVQVFARIRN